VALLLPLAAFLVVTWLRGWQLQAVQSGSMAPTYPVGSLLVAEPIDASEVKPGMVIVFSDPLVDGRVVSHRVVGRAPAERLAFWTQGDANGSRDPVPVPARMIQARVRWQVTHLGAVLTWLRWPRSFLLFVLGPAVLLAAGELRERRRSPSRRRTETAPT
jgi:signal peptidase